LLSATVATNRGSASSRLLAPLAVCAAVVGAVFALRLQSTPQPTLIGARSVVPIAITRAGGAWYWIEKADAPKKSNQKSNQKPPSAPETPNAQLVRATSQGVTPVATAEEIGDYSVDGGQLAWSERAGPNWTIQLAQADGSGKRQFWAGDTEPMGLALSDGRLYWLQRVKAPAANGEPFPPLMDTMELQAAPVAGGTPATLCRLWEAERGKVLGAHNGSIYVAAYRHTSPGNLVLYRVASDGRLPVRVAAERANPAALLTHDGALYWLAASNETISAYCVHRLSPDGTIQTLSDWLPTDVTLYETEHGVVCIDQNPTPNVWIVGSQEVYPLTVAAPQGYVALAAGEHEVLLARTIGAVATPNLYGMQAP
jgi:hypothetical protein